MIITLSTISVKLKRHSTLGDICWTVVTNDVTSYYTFLCAFFELHIYAGMHYQQHGLFVAANERPQ